MSYSVKKSKSTSAKFKAFAVDGTNQFIDTETGEVVDINTIIAKTFGENTPVDINVSIKTDEDVTDEV